MTYDTDEPSAGASEAPQPPDLLAGEEPAQEPAPVARRPVALIVLCGVFFLGAVGMAIVAASLQGDLREKREVNEVERTASEVTRELLTYDYQQIDRTRERVLDLAVGRFRQEYEESFPALKELIVAVQGTSAVEVKDVFTSDVSGDTASAVVVCDQRVEGTSGTRTRPNSYVRLSLVKVKGEWKVDDVIVLDLGQAATTNPAVPPTTTTSTPSG